MVLAFITGFLSYLGIGVLSKFDLAERFQPLSMVCLVVFGVTFGARLLWGLVVLVRKAVLRHPRRQALAAAATRIGWRWFADARSVPTVTRTALRHIDPKENWKDDEAKPRYSELAYGMFAGRPAFSVHIERGSRLLPTVFQLVALQLPGTLPELRISDRADDPYGYRSDQQFESARFNYAWGVHTDDNRYGSAFAHPRMMQLLNGLDPSIAAVHVRGSWLVSRAPVAFSPALLHVHLDALARITDAIPDWVWDEFGHRAPAASFLA